MVNKKLFILIHNYYQNLFKEYKLNLIMKILFYMININNCGLSYLIIKWIKQINYILETNIEFVLIIFK